jgi:hypothetical protein
MVTGFELGSDVLGIIGELHREKKRVWWNADALPLDPDDLGP